MRRSILRSALSVLLPGLACVLPDDGDDTGGQGTGDAADDGPDPGSGTTANGGDDGATAADDDSSVDDTGAGSSGADDSATTGDAPLGSCIDGTVVLGNPYYEGLSEGWNPSGQGVHEDPPVPSRHLAVVGDDLFLDTQAEIWVSDGTTVRRIAGRDNVQEYQPVGECDDIRFLISAGITELPNGNVVVADFQGNGLVELSDPAGDCTAAPIAGNAQPATLADLVDVAFPGDVDGPGATAMFYGPQRLTADEEGNIYVIDTGNFKIKRIAADADRTVTTLTAFADGQTPFAMTAMNGMLYVTGGNGVGDFIWAIDLSAPGSYDVLADGTGLFEELPDGTSALLFAATNDGVDLILASHKGYLFRVTTDGYSLGAIAGTGQVTSFPDGLDVTMPIPADQLPLRSYSSGEADLVRRGNDLLFTGADGPAYHVWQIRCGG
jgi:hypothetical protein